MAEGTDRYGTPDDVVELERRRLARLAEARDPSSRRALERVGVGPGMRALEVGAGNGSMAAALADMVGSTGQVVSLDIDVQFHATMPEHVTVIQHDLETDTPVPGGPFDVIHARAVLQHLPHREAVLTRLVALLCPGGWIVVEDSNMLEFAAQALPEPYGEIHRLMAGAQREEWREPNCGIRVPNWFTNAGLTDIDSIGEVWTMRPGEAGGEWWFLALERTLPLLTDAGICSSETAAEVLAQVRAPGFTMLSPTSITTVGRAPQQ